MDFECFLTTILGITMDTYSKLSVEEEWKIDTTYDRFLNWYVGGVA